MQHIREILTAMALTVIMTFQASGATPTDSVKVYFQIGYSRFNPSIGDNRALMDRFIEEVCKAREANEIDSIVVRAYASPDGTSTANIRLARNRCYNIAELISERADINPDLIRTYPEGIAWDELRRIVADNPEVPSREKILNILDNVGEWVYNSSGAIVDSRKKRLMDLDGGNTYRWLYANIFPELRNAVAIALFTNRNVTVTVVEPEFATNLAEQIDITEISEQSEMSEQAEISERSEISEQSEISERSDFLKNHVRDFGRKPLYMAVKTNMLYDAVLVPNIGAEFYIGKDFSVYGEWMYAWWHNDRHHRYWRIYGGDIGLRWWFGSKAHSKPMTGHHAGVYGGIMTFDFETGDTGYMGGKPGGTLWDRWLVNAGLEYGYSLPVAKRLNIDFSIGLGYLGGNYIKYYPFDNDYYHDKEYKMHYFGPTKAEISLIWLIGRGNTNSRKGGER